MSIKLYFFDEGQHQSSDRYKIIECLSESVPRVGEKVSIANLWGFFDGIVREVTWIIEEKEDGHIDQEVTIVCHGREGFRCNFYHGFTVN